MLFIRSRRVTGWDDPDIVNSVGPSYMMSEQASAIVDWYLQPHAPAHYFPSRAAFRRAVMNRVTAQNHLIIQLTYNNTGAYRIAMSGSRSRRLCPRPMPQPACRALRRATPGTIARASAFQTALPEPPSATCTCSRRGITPGIHTLAAWLSMSTQRASHTVRELKRRRIQTELEGICQEAALPHRPRRGKLRRSGRPRALRGMVTYELRRRELYS